MSVLRAGEILDRVQERPSVGDPGVRIVAIDGPAGSGKTTLAGELRATAQVLHGFTPPVIGVDDFVGWTDLDPEGMTWWPRWEREILAPLLEGRDPAWGRRDWWQDADGDSLLPEPATAAWAPIAIVEGVSVARAVATTRLAFTVWVEAPQEVRLARGIERDGAADREHWREWQAMETAFFDVDRTRERADLIVAT